MLSKIPPLLFSAAILVIPFAGNAGAEATLTVVGVMAIVAIGLNLLIGYGGMISFGHTAFMAFGAYATGLLTTKLGWTPMAAMTAGLIGTAGAAYVIGIPILRVRGHYLAMVTLAFGVVVYGIGTRWTEVTGGLAGVVGVPDFDFFGIPFDSRTKMFYLIWAVVLIVFLLTSRIIHSRFGLRLRALGAHESAAEALGVPVGQLRLQIFVLSAVYAALAGSLYAHYLNYANSSFFDLLMNAQLLAILVIGGIGSMWGPIVGSVLLVTVSQSLGANFAEYSLLIFGLLYAGALLFFPKGIVGAISALSNQFISRRQVRRSGIGARPGI